MPPEAETQSDDGEAGDSNGPFLYIRCSETLKKQVRGAAGLRDLDMSEYARQVLREASENELYGEGAGGEE